MIRTFTFSGACPFGMTPSTTISLLWLFTVAIRTIPFTPWHLKISSAHVNQADKDILFKESLDTFCGL